MKVKKAGTRVAVVSPAGHTVSMSESQFHLRRDEAGKEFLLANERSEALQRQIALLQNTIHQHLLQAVKAMKKMLTKEQYDFVSEVCTFTNVDEEEWINLHSFFKAVLERKVTSDPKEPVEKQAFIVTERYEKLPILPVDHSKKFSEFLDSLNQTLAQLKMKFEAKGHVYGTSIYLYEIA